MARSLRRKLKQIDRAKTLSAEERARLILDDRTRHLSERPDAQAVPVGATARILVCGAGRERFGIGIGAVAEVLPSRECVPVPGGPAALVGVLGHNGRLVSVIDLAMALGLAADDRADHLVLLRREQPRVALRVGRAHEVSSLTLVGRDEAGRFRNDAVIGYAKVRSGPAEHGGILSILDIDRLLQPFLPSPASGA